VFVALADPTRRAVIRRLGEAPSSVGDLAREFPMTLPSFTKHVRTPETNGLIRTTKSGRGAHVRARPGTARPRRGLARRPAPHL